MKTNNFQTPTEKIQIFPNLVLVTMNPLTVMDEEAMERYLGILNQNLSDDKYLFIVNASCDMWSISKGAVDMLLSNQDIMKKMIAKILIVPNLASRLLIKFYLGVAKPNVVVKIVKSQNQAADWLYEI